MRRALVGLVSTAAFAALSLTRIAPAVALGAPLDPILLQALATAGPGDHVQAVVVLPAVPSASTLASLRATGAQAIGYERLRMAAVSATPLQIQALAALPIVQSIWGNHGLELYLHESTVQIQANEVHAAPFGFNGAGIGVAVLDAGIDGGHPDLHYPDHVVQNVKILGFQQAVPSASFAQENVQNTDLTSGHGTHVAGIVGASGAASNGYYQGVAPGADLIGLGSGEAVELLTALGGYDWMLKNKDRYNIRVMNNSWGDKAAGESADDPLNQASLAAHDAGITVVFASGNDGQTSGDVFNRYARWPWVISVGGVDKLSAEGTYTSRGNATLHPDVAAPGSWITSARSTTGGYTAGNSTPFDLTDPANPRMIPTEYTQYYTNTSGTSMAAPHVSGMVALLLQANPALTPDQIRSLVISTATPLPSCPITDCGAGLVNVLAATQAALAARNHAPVARLTAIPPIGPAPLAVTLNASASTDDDGTVASYRWDTDGDGTVDTTTSTAIVTHVYASGVFHPSVVVVDDRGLASAVATVEVRASSPPDAVAIVPKHGKSAQAVTFDASSSTDPDGHVVSYQFTFGDGTTLTSATGIVTHAYLNSRPFVYGWSVQVTDDAGITDAVGDTIKITP